MYRVKAVNVVNLLQTVYRRSLTTEARVRLYTYFNVFSIPKEGTKMRKAEINNEIVSIRRTVRQARVCVINKLIREAKRLRTNRGDEKQLERNKNKSDRLLREVYALKRIEDDKITKYGIVLAENLHAAASSSMVDDTSRAMARVARHKSLDARLARFREKFPDYKEHVFSSKGKGGVSTKRHTADSVNDSLRASTKKSKRRKSNSEEGFTTQSVAKDTLRRSSRQEVEKLGNEIGRSSETDSVTDSTRSPQNERLAGDEGSEERFSNAYKTKTRTDKLQEELTEMPKEESAKRFMETSTGKCAANKPTLGVGIVSKEATVKKFTEILSETTTEQPNFQLPNRSMEGPERADDFFLSANQEKPEISGKFKPSPLLHSSSAARNKPCAKPESRMRIGRKFRNDDLPWGHNSSNRRKELGAKDATRAKRDTIQEAKTSNKKVASVEKFKSDNQGRSQNLHPSWAAKRKERNIAKTGFQGKKIIFQEDE